MRCLFKLSGIFFICLFLESSTNVINNSYKVNQDQIVDQSQSNWETNQKILAIGDIHGDFAALVKILIGADIIEPVKDDIYKWTGGKTHVVLVGDVVDRGDDSKRVMDHLMKWQHEAIKSGGFLHVLLGNHEMMLSSNFFQYTDKGDLETFSHFTKTEAAKVLMETRSIPSDYIGAIVAYSSEKESVYARWIASLPSIIRVGGVLFMHAGFEKWLLYKDMDEVNELVRNDIRYNQALVVKDKELIELLKDKPRWGGNINSDDGPLFSRLIASGKLDKSIVKDVMERFNVRKIVLGHSISDNREIKEIKAYDGNVVLIDIGMSNGFERLTPINRLQALEITHVDDTMEYRALSFNTNGNPKENRSKKLLSISFAVDKVCSDIYDFILAK